MWRSSLEINPEKSILLSLVNRTNSWRKMSILTTFPRLTLFSNQYMCIRIGLSFLTIFQSIHNNHSYWNEHKKEYNLHFFFCSLNMSIHNFFYSILEEFTAIKISCCNTKSLLYCTFIVLYCHVQWRRLYCTILN